jgi:hypothetical protein
VYGRFKIALVELTCPWDTDAKRAEECKTARYADLKEELSNQGWDCSLYLIKAGAQGHIVKSVWDRFRSLFRAWLPAGVRSGIGQMIKDVSRISLVCSFAIFHPRGGPLPPSPPIPKPSRPKKGGGALLLLFFDCIDTLPIAPVGLVLSCRCPLPCCCSTSSCCSVVSVYRPWS